MSINPRFFESAMPNDVRAAIDQGRLGGGPVATWLGAVLAAQLEEALRLVRAPEQEPAELVGWIVGMTMIGDTHRVLAAEIVSGRHVELIPYVIDAFAAGVRAKYSGPKKQWATIEQLVVRAAAVPESLVQLLPTGCCHDYPPTRDVAIRIAALAGEPGRAVLVKAREALEPERRVERQRIDAALKALVPRARPSDDGLLARMLDAWRATRDPALEPSIALLGSELARIRGPVVSSGDFEVAWLALAQARDPGDLDRLLDAAWPARLPAMLARLDALALRGADPRFGKLLELAVAYEGWTDPEVHIAIAKLLEPIANERMRLALGAIVRSRQAMFPHYANVRRAIDEARTQPADPNLLDDIRVALQPLADRRAVLEQHATTPADRDLRAVLADILVEQGDPRGEFIALQTAIADAAAGDKAAKRAAKLLEAHRDVWLGPLPDVLDARFERGFLVAVRSTAGDDRFRASFDCIEWSTVERLEVPASRVDPTALVHRMPLLQVFAVMHKEVLEALERSGPHPGIRALAAIDHWLPDTLDAFPDLAVIGGRWHVRGREAWANLLRRAAKLRLHAIVSFSLQLTGLVDACADRASGPPVTRFTVFETFEPTHWRLEIPRTGMRAFAAYTGDVRSARYQLVELVRELANAGFKKLSLYGEQDAWWTLAELAAELRQERMAIELDGIPIDLAGAP